MQTFIVQIHANSTIAYDVRKQPRNKLKRKKTRIPYNEMIRLILQTVLDLWIAMKETMITQPVGCTSLKGKQNCWTIPE